MYRKLTIALIIIVLISAFPMCAFANTSFNRPFPIPSDLSGMDIEGLIDPPSPFVWQNSFMSDITWTAREEGLEMQVTIPELTEEYGPARFTVNNEIERVVEVRISAAKEAKARSIVFDYEVYYTDTMISIIILSTVTSFSSREEVMSVNFEPQSGRLIPISEALGVDITPLAAKYLMEKIRLNPERFKADFNVLTGDTAFYLTESRLNLLFDELKLSTMADGITRISLELERIRSITVSREDYVIQPGGYNLKMMPLALICDGLGYHYSWFNYDRRVTVRRGDTVIELYPAENNYLVHGRKQRTLEAAPVILNNRIYVPISFFDQILSLTTFAMDEDENIIFLTYLE